MLPDIKVLRQSTIPKIIHQTWKTDIVPDHWKSSQIAWLSFVEKDSDWQYVLWTDEMNRELVVEHYTWFLEIYDNFPHNIQRADTVRYLILNKYGGIYCDLDIEPKQSFLKLFELYKDEEVVIAKSATAAYLKFQPLTNSFMMSVPDALFWKYVFQELTDPYDDKNRRWKKFLARMSRHFSIIFSTGPGVVNAAWKRYRNHPNTRALKPIPMEFTQPIQEWEIRPSDTEDSYVRLLANGSWHQSDSTFFRRLSKFWNLDRDMFFIPMLLLFIILFVTFLVLYVKAIKRSKTV